MELNERMAAIFDPVDGVDFVITASNPDVAFDADGSAARRCSAASRPAPATTAG